MTYTEPDRDYTKIPNKILDAVPFMSGAEARLTMAIARLTFGYHTESTRMTYDDMKEATGLSKPAISAAIDLIEKRGFFVRGRRSMWSINSKLFLLKEVNESKEMLPNEGENSKKSLPYESKKSLPSSIKEKKEEKDNPLPPKPKKRKTQKQAAFEIPETLNTPAFTAVWNDFVQHRREIKKPLTPLAAKKQLNILTKWGVARAIAAIDYSIAKGWQGIFENKDTYTNGQASSNGRMTPAPASERTPGAY